MHLKNNERVYRKLVRSCSFVLSMLLICSMLFVGNIVDFKAEAVEFSNCIYFDFNAAGTDKKWISSNARPAVWWWGTNESGTFTYLDVYNSSTNLYVLYIPDGKTCTGFKCLRMANDSNYTNVSTMPRDTDGLWTQTDDITVSSEDNIFYVNYNGSNQIGDSGWYTDSSLPSTRSSLRGNTEMTAKIDDLKNNDSSTNYGIGSKTGGDLVELYPVDAVFYDYLTDQELVYGWRKSTNSEQISRSYKNRIPYKGFNNYLSNYADENNWNYPLYFGNFTSHWSSTDDPNDATYSSYSHTFADFRYGILKDVNMYDGDTMITLPENAQTFFRREPLTSSYTYGLGLNHFSIYANDSEALNEKTGSYSGSVQGLVEANLSGSGSDIRNRQLQMVGEVLSPYFSGTNTYTNTVSTKFPMRVNSENSTTVDGTTVNYTTYEFDSKGKGDNNNDGANKDTGNPDIIYFTYGDDGKPNTLEYTQDKTKQVIDAYNSLGGNTDYDDGINNGNHRGFFPFDQGDGTSKKIAYDYGFGMRLDIDFNLTEDGYVMGRDSNGKLYSTNEPMKFTFDGDDDVWVFYDGKLALDLGGDHGNASGNINFALKDKGSNTTKQKATVSTHAVTLKSSPSYGSTEYAAKANDESDISSIFEGDYTDSTKTAYDVTKRHTLTVFYMERGLVESNLRLSFSISPIGNRLTVDNVIDYDGVNNIVKSRVADYIESENGQTSHEKFDFTVDDETTGKSMQYKKDDQTYNYNATTGAEVDHEELIEFTDQIKDGNDVTVDEKTNSGNSYHYTTTYSVIDNFMKKNNQENNSVDSGYTLKDKVNADSPHDGEGGSVKFAFDTQSNVTGKNKYNDFSVSAVNKIKVGDVGLKKVIANSGSDNTEFTFDVFVKLPHEEKYQDTKDTTITCTANNDTATEIKNLPVGSTVKFVEKMTESQGQSYTAGAEYIEIVVEESDTATVGTYNNTKNAASATISAAKTLDGNASSVKFDFALTKLNSGVKSTNASDKQTVKNGTDGSISFTLSGLDYGSTYDYLLEETSVTNADYTCDTNKYWVTVNTGTSPATVTYNNATVNGSTYTKGTVVNSVTFANTTISKKGYLQVIKRGSNRENADFKGTQFTVYEVTGNNEMPAANAKSTVLTVKTSAEYNDVTSHYESYVVSEELDLGWYYVVETKSPNHYELSGEGQWVQVTADDTATSPAKVTFTNRKSTELPTTGGIGVVVFITIGVVLIGAAIMLLRPKKEAKK